MGASVLEVPPWAQAGARPLWLNKGVVAVERVKESGGDLFVIVQPVGWTGETGWIPAKAVTTHLRPLVSREVAAGWRAQLLAPPVTRTQGNLTVRRTRHQRIAERGSPEQQVAALTEAYTELHQPDPDDVRLLEHLEGLVLSEIAEVLGEDAATLRAMMRDGRSRFDAGAPRSGEVVETPPVGPAMADGLDWFTSFEVRRALHISDLRDASYVVPAVPGLWHAAWTGPYESGWVVLAESVRQAWPLDDDDHRVLGVTPGDTFPVAVLDDGALQDPTIDEEVWGCEQNDVQARGAAAFWKMPVEVRVWEREGQVVAVRLTRWEDPAALDDDDARDQSDDDAVDDD